MTAHEKLHLNKQKFQCLECDQILSKRYVLKKHMRTHVSWNIAIRVQYVGGGGGCSYLCNSFPILFLMEMQTKETPYLCDICGKSFGSPASLHCHLKYHFDELNAECYLCKRRVISMHTLQEHMRRHVS